MSLDNSNKQQLLDSQEQTESSSSSFNKFLIYMQTFGSSIGFYFIGYNIALMNPLKDILSQSMGWNDKSQLYLSIANCLFFVGNFLGGIIAGKLLDKYTKRKINLGTDLVGMLVMVGTLMHVTSVFLVARLAAGVVAGVYSTVIPVYILETTPKHQQGRFAGIYHIQLPVGVTSVFALGTYLPPALLSTNTYVKNHWNDFMILFPALLLMFKFLLFLLLLRQDTAQDMVREKRSNESILKVLHKMYDTKQSEFELQCMLERQNVQSEELTMQDILSKCYKKQFLLSLLLATAFCFTCINLLSCYSVLILQKVEGMPVATAIWWSFAITLLETLANLAAIFFIDKVGKKRMLMIGYFLTILALLSMSLTAWFKVANAQQVIFVFYFIVFGISFDSLVFIIMADLIPGIGFGFCIGFLYLLGGLLVLVYPVLINSFVTYQGTMFIFFFISSISFIILYIHLPETNGLNFQEVYQLFQKQNDKVKDEEDQNQQNQINN